MRTYFWLLFLHVYYLNCYEIWHEVDSEIYELDYGSENVEVLNGTLRNIVKKYHCSVENVQDERTILYGTKAWSFPIQDVNLTLRYPSTNTENYSHEEDVIITGVLVILYIDGPQSRGYITQGGILRDRISMTFLVGNITRLTYQFWLFGVKKNHINMSEYSWHQNLCI